MCQDGLDGGSIKHLCRFKSQFPVLVVNSYYVVLAQNANIGACSQFRLMKNGDQLAQK